MPESSPPDRPFKALQASYRRQLLFALLEANPQSDTNLDPLHRRLDDPVSDGDDDRRKLELIHNHLPKLDAWGYIDWDQATGQITKGPNWNEIAPLLRLIHDHQEKLPGEWI